MSDTRKIAICILGSLTLYVAAQAVVADPENPYQGILDRNVFGLKPPAPISTNVVKQIDAPKITLAGITTIFGNKRVLMNVAMPAKAGEPAKQQSFILAEGQRDGDIEILEIDEKIGTVKVNDFGTVLTLNLEKDGAKLPASVAAAAPAGPQLNAIGYAPPHGASATMTPVPTRPINNAFNGTANAGTANGQAQGGQLPAGFGAAQGLSRVAAQPALSHDEQTIMMEANHELAKSLGDDSARLFPPTELNPTRNTGEAQTPGGQSPGFPGAPTPQPQRFQIPGNPRLPQ